MIPLSAVLAYLAACFQKSYLGGEKFSLKGCLPKEMRFLLIAAVSYITAAVFFIAVFPHQEVYTFFRTMQFVLLWDALLLIAYTDFKVKKVPNKVLLVLLCIRIPGMLLEIFVDGSGWQMVVIGSLISMLIGAFIILICMLFSRGGIGAGDLKLYAVVGLYCGFEALINVMFVSIFSAAIVSIVLLLSRKVKLKSTLPMGPFVWIGLTVYLVLRYH